MEIPKLIIVNTSDISPTDLSNNLPTISKGIGSKKNRNFCQICKKNISNKKIIKMKRGKNNTTFMALSPHNGLSYKNQPTKNIIIGETMMPNAGCIPALNI